MGSRIIALDADGVLLDYHLAYASAWQRAFGVYPQEKDPDAYWPMDRWEVQRLTGEPLEQFRRSFDELFWAGVPAIEGAVQACHALTNAGHELVCVSALPAKFRQARERNLRQLGFPIEMVYATDNTHGLRSPKADLLNTIRPLAFVDDFLPYLVGVEGSPRFQCNK
ncbi:MAG: HAD family hydrolase [Bradyrhizobium sp.]|uniref:HAD family hydrolase n=1 Tax=Bradyrhizobium sp. TaxID=376 RepID=UPI003D122576